MVRVAKWATCGRMAVATLLFVLGPAGSAAAASLIPGVIQAEQRTFEAPSTNVLERLTPTQKTVSIPIRRSFAVAHENIFSGLFAGSRDVGSFPIEVDWSIGPGPAGTLSASQKEVKYASGTVRFAEGQRDAEIAVTLLGQPDDGQQRQFTLHLNGVRFSATPPTIWQQWTAQEIYRPDPAAYAQTITRPPSFNCELRDRLMSIQVPPDGNASWCPQRASNEFRWTHPIVVNGIRLEPAAGVAFTFKQDQHLLSTGGGKATPRLRCSSCQSGLTFAAQPIEWTADNSGPEKSLRLASTSTGGGQTLFGFALGLVEIAPIKFTESQSALLPAGLRFPAAIRSIIDYSAQVIMRSQNPTGLVVDELHLSAPVLPFGKFTLSPFDLRYSSAEDLWSAHVGLMLPTRPGVAALRTATPAELTDLRHADPELIERSLKVTPASSGVLRYPQDKLIDFFLQDSITVDAKLAITGTGQLRSFEAGVVFAPSIPLGGGIGLHQLRAGWMRPFLLNGGPVTVGPFAVSGPEGMFGTIGLAAGPRVGKFDAFTFDGTLAYVAADPATGAGWQLLATGSPKLFGYELASGGLRYVNGESLTARFALAHRFAGGGFELGFDAQLEATLFFEPLDFFALAEGGVRIKTPDLPPQPFCVGFCLPSEGLDIEARGGAAVNKNGISVCSNGMGVKYLWADETFDMFLGCDNDRLRSAIGARAAAARSGSPTTAGAAAAGTESHTVTIRDGVPYEVLQVRGPEGPPELRIEGPGGFRFVTPEDRSPLVGEGRPVRFVQAPGNVTWVQIMNPRPGRYRVTPIRRSAIGALAQASGLREPVVKAEVGGKGATRTLRYSVRQDDSQTVRLVEYAGPAHRVIRTVRGSGRGTVRFRPMAATARGGRTVTALLQTRGTPAGRRTLERFRFSEPRVRTPKISTRRTGDRVRVAWTRVPHAAGYELTLTLADGQRLFLPMDAKRRALRLGTLASGQNGTVSIRATDRLGRSGASASTRYRAVR